MGGSNVAKKRYGDEFVRCRTIGHAWDEIPPVVEVWRDTGGMAALTLRCVRCGSMRHDLVSMSTGNVYGRKYDYEAGYNVARDERLTKQEYRLVMMRRGKRKKLGV
jgi:hypothetical protein